jgi:hypothetical protein
LYGLFAILVSRSIRCFLVQQTAEQARREGVPLSELEKRMMYFPSKNKRPATVRGR